MERLDWLTYDHFAQRAGERFDVALIDRPLASLVLVEAREGELPGGPGPDGQERMQFSVIFRGELAPVLLQGTYHFSHAAVGEFDLFIVPIGPDAEGMRYEAAFA